MPIANIIELSAGDTHVCLRQRSGQVSCFGSAAALGDGTGTSAAWPRNVSGFP
jgi:hypothetical protein